MFSARLNLLGTFEFFNAETGQKIKLAYTKLTLLLTYLALEPRAHTRESLVDLLWPELDEHDGKANLRRALFNLQQAFVQAKLEKSLLYADRSIVHLSEERFWIDADEFENWEKIDCIKLTDQQLELYRGPLLDGIFPAGERLANWLQLRRARCEQKNVSLLEHAIVLHANAGEFDVMERRCRQLISVDFLNELAHSRLMHMYLEMGNQVAARSIYDAYCSMTQQHLGTAPPQEIAMLFEKSAYQSLPATQAARSNPVLGKFSVPETRREYRLVSTLYIELLPLVHCDREAWLRMSAAAIVRLRGLLSKYCGTFRQQSNSIVIAYFGYPVSHEFITEWSLAAGLSIRQCIADEFRHVGIRSAVHADIMMTGPGYTLPDILGECTTIARNLAESAPMGALIASEETRHGIASLFDMKSLDGAPHKAVEVHALREPCNEMRNVARSHRCTFVGRLDELKALDLAWTKASVDGGICVQLSGEAGVGKSRLIQEFLGTKSTQFENAHRACFHIENLLSPLHPILALVRSLGGISGNAGSGASTGSASASVPPETVSIDESELSLLSNLLYAHEKNIRGYPIFEREKLFSSLAGSLKKNHKGSLTVLVFEDIQWADKVSLDFIAWLREREMSLGIFLIVTCRKHPKISGPALGPAILMDIQPLDMAEATSLALQFSQFLEASPTWQSHLLKMADGIPLFLEKLLQDPNPEVHFTCPKSLRNLLTERIDMLGEIRHVLCHASCIGFQFGLHVLAEIESVSIRKCQQLIQTLVASGLIEKKPEAGHFQFRYRLVREVAYGMLTFEERQQILAKIARPNQAVSAHPQ
ncbi:AAA ATPase-like protein [Collimonas sp. PA-H2]|uniref:AAA family ATPase n=1 Tax=Collimonas sp. PA-H2 TaxID=1881062 RepID=UPI000BF37B6B|nr:AAA family ATPase [Collimonas sp. PA-H2]PFH10047.1 AAA ATPase-like protein [Collimonas sp. PA-H2]